MDVVSEDEADICVSCFDSGKSVRQSTMQVYVIDELRTYHQVP